MIGDTRGNRTIQADGRSAPYNRPSQEMVKRSPTIRPRLAICVAAALVGVIVTVASFYPGYMSTDSLAQFSDARTGTYDSGHPAIMSAVWSVLNRIVPGPLGMLLLHNLVFWVSLSLVVYLARIGSAAAGALILAIGLFPPNFIMLAQIWKDVGMGATLLSAYALLLLADRKQSRTLVIAGLGSLFYPLAVRYNGALAVLPLAIWGGCIATRVFSGGIRKSLIGGVGLGVAAFLLLLIMSVTTNRTLTGGRATYPIQTILSHDLAGISVRSDAFLMPRYVVSEVPTMNLEVLKTTYSPHLDSIFWRRDSLPTFPWVDDEERFSQLLFAWTSTVPTHLPQYFAHRWDVFRSQMSIGTPRVCYPYALGIQENEWGLTVLRSPLNLKVMEIINSLEHGLLFRGWFYLILVLAVPFILAAVFRATAIQTIVLGLSGAMYALGYLFVGQGCEFRFMWWPVLVTVLLPIVAFCKAGRDLDS
jgi:hypothetical protein